MLGKSFTPNHTKLTSSKGAFLATLGTGTVRPKGCQWKVSLPFSSSLSTLMLMQLHLHCRMQSLSNRGASQTKKAEAFCKPDETFVTLLTWPNSMNILVDLGLINNPQKERLKKVMIGHGQQRHAWVIHHQGLFSMLNDGCQRWLFRLVMPDLGAFGGANGTKGIHFACMLMSLFGLRDTVPSVWVVWQ
jgi:hypothetical protein